VLIEALSRVDCARLRGRWLEPPRLVIVGDGSTRAQLEQQARVLGVAERVHFAGFRHDARRAFAGFDVTVIPSRHEPQGLVCLEAMAAASPVVASDTGACRR